MKIHNDYTLDFVSDLSRHATLSTLITQSPIMRDSRSFIPCLPSSPSSRIDVYYNSIERDREAIATCASIFKYSLREKEPLIEAHRRNKLDVLFGIYSGGSRRGYKSEAGTRRLIARRASSDATMSPAVWITYSRDRTFFLARADFFCFNECDHLR